VSYYYRSPIVVVLGHVDVGKTALLDKIRGTAVTLKEPGTMTQHIGASFLPWNILEKMCGPLVKAVKARVKIPGILVIDTPGHEAFANLRRRGGSIADLAILVIDVLKGFERQTYECIEILRSRSTMFIIAANKIDKIPGWNPQPGKPFVETIKYQREDVQIRLEEYLYRIIAEMNKLGYRCDRYDRVRDFSKTVAIIPTSALTGEGIPDLLLVLAGMAQKYLLDRLKTTARKGKGVVLEVREEPGLGTVVDTILYDGIIRKGDLIVVGGLGEPIVTKVKALLMPKPMDEMRSPEDRFKSVEKVMAAAGVRIVATNLDKAVAGAPVIVVEEAEIEKAVKEVIEEISSIRFSKEVNGVVAKADTLGTLEALVNYLEAKGIPVRYADVGPVTKRDIVEAFLVKEKEKNYGVVLAFNVKVYPEAEDEAYKYGVRIFRNNILYRLVEEYLEWIKMEKDKRVAYILSKCVLPGKIRILPGYVFRRSNPAIVGVEVLAGRIKPGYPLIKENGRRIGEIMQIQEHGKPISEATAGMAVAISIRGDIIVGRQVKEGDILYTDIPFSDAQLIAEELREVLSEEEFKVLEEIMAIKRKHLLERRSKL